MEKLLVYWHGKITFIINCKQSHYIQELATNKNPKDEITLFPGLSWDYNSNGLTYLNKIYISSMKIRELVF